MLKIQNGLVQAIPSWDVKKIYQEVLNLEDYKYNNFFDEELEKDCTYFYSFQKFFLEKTLMSNKLLSHTQFSSQYEAHNARVIDDTYIMVGNKKYLREGLKSHIWRTYPSLIRDFHFYYLLLESNLFSEVNYCYDLDTKQKIDISVLTKENETINLRLFVDTPKSRYYYNIKNNTPTKEKTIDIPLNFSDCFKTPNGYYLYTRRYVKMIV